MIIRSSYVGDDPDRSRHLRDAENNERVIERHDLDRSCPDDLDQALRMFSALSAANPRARITTVHIKCSPSRPLTEEGLLRLIAVVEREHGIPPDHPRKVIVHAKGDRPMHVHLVYAAVNPRTGRVLSSKKNYRADELASRVLEIEFGEAVTPGPRIRQNEAALRGRGDDAMAAVLAQYEPVRNRDRDSEADRQQGARTKMPVREFRRLLARALGRVGPSLPVPRALLSGGFAVAIGDRRDVLMAVHLPTGAAYSLQKSLRKIMPKPVILGDDDLAILRAQARPLAEVVHDGLVTSQRRAEMQVDREIRRGLFEAAIDGDTDAFFSEARRKRTRQQQHDETISLQARRGEILAANRAALLLRQRRIDRAFRSARILQSRRLRKAAFVLAASGALLAGVGFPLAIGAGLAATVAMKGKAEALRAEARELIAMRRQQAPVPSRPPAPASRPAVFDFNAVPKESRVLAGIALRHMLQGWNTDLTTAVARALGPEVMDSLRALHDAGSEKQKTAVMAWASNSARHIFAAASALRRAGEADAAASLEQAGRRKSAKAREPGPDRGRG